MRRSPPGSRTSSTTQLRQDPSGVEALPDSSLYLRWARYWGETAWAPPYAGKDLRQVRIAQLDMTSRQVRHHAEALRGEELA